MDENNKTRIVKRETIVKSSIGVFVSNLILVIVGIITGFIVPNVLGVLQYGYFETFVLYATYTTFLQLGFINGIYLIFGDKNLEDLDKKLFRMFFKFFFALELTISCVLLITGLFLLKVNILISEILLFLAIYNLATNIMTYFQLLSQITMRFKEFSSRTIFQSIFKIIIIVITLVVYFVFGRKDVNYLLYTILYVGLFVGLALWYIFTYKDIVFGESYKIREHKKEIFGLFKTGFPLLVADVIVVFIYKVDKQVVDLGFSKTVFSYFAFAYSVIALVTTLINSLKTTIYPVLKRSSNKLEEQTQSFFSVVLHGSAFLMASYFVIAFIINRFMPKYNESIHTLILLFPTMLITAVINIVFQNVFKTKNKNLTYSIISGIILALSIILDLSAYFFFKNVDAIVIATITTFIIWYFINAIYLRKLINLGFIKNTVFMFLYIGLFLFVAYLCKNYILGFFLFIVIAILLLFVFVLTQQNNDFLKAITSNKILNRVHNIVTNKKSRKAIILSSIPLICVFLAGTFSGSLYKVSKTEACAVYISSKSSKDGFVYSQIKSDVKNETFQNFMVNTTIHYGEDLKSSASRYIEALEEENNKPFTFIIGDKEINVNVLSSPTNNPNSVYNSFVFYDDSLIEERYDFSIDATDIYLTESVAAKLLGFDEINENKIKELINSTVICKTFSGGVNEFKIIGIIKDSSIGVFELREGKNFVLTNFTFSLHYLSGFNKNISTFYYPGRTSLTTYMVAQKYSLESFSYYENYFDFNEGVFSIKDIQSRINQIDKAYSNKTIGVVSISILSLCAILTSLIGILYIRKYVEDRNHFICIIRVLSSLLFILFLLFALAIDYLFIGSYFILLNSFYGIITIFIVFSIVFAITYILQKTYIDEFSSKNDYLEVNI